VYVYGTNNVPDPNPTTGEGIDLLQVKRKNGGSYDLIASYTYDARHQPLTITDARGAVTTYTYNPQGQVLTVTTPPAEGHSQGATTSFTYDTNGYLQQVSGPVPGATRASPTTATAGSAPPRMRPAGRSPTTTTRSTA